MVIENLCPVCGYEMEEPPRDYNICPSCGTEFGVHDLNASIAELRAAWIQSGPSWWSKTDPQPENWNSFAQLAILMFGSGSCVVGRQVSDFVVQETMGAYFGEAFPQGIFSGVYGSSVYGTPFEGGPIEPATVLAPTAMALLSSMPGENRPSPARGLFHNVIQDQGKIVVSPLANTVQQVQELRAA